MISRILPFLRHQILSLALGLTLLSILIVVSAFLKSTSDSIAESAQDDIERALIGLRENISARDRQLREIADAILPVLAEPNPAVIQGIIESSVSANRGFDAEADLVLLLDQAGHIKQQLSGQSFDAYQLYPGLFTPLIGPSLGSQSDFIVLGHQVYQTVVLAIQDRGQDTSKNLDSGATDYLLVGSILGQSSIQSLGNLSGIDLILMEQRTITPLVASLDRWVFASTLPGLEDIRDALASLDGLSETPLSTWYLSQPYSNRTVTIAQQGGSSLRLVLSKSLVPYYENFDSLQFNMLKIVGVIFLLAVIGSYFISRNLTVPLNRLVQATSQISAGRFHLLPKTPTGSREVKALVDAFQRMNQDLAERERKIRHQATHDSLTNVLNRDHLFEKLSEFVAEYHPFILVGISITQFRNINDSLGNDTADDFLIELGQRIRAEAYRGLVARTGPSEFCCVLDATHLFTEQDIKQSCQSLVMALQRPVVLNDHKLHSEACLSLVSFPDHADHLAALNRCHSIATEYAKRNREPLYFFRSELEQERIERIRVVKALKEVLAQDSDQLALFYQPKRQLQSGRITKLEALLRWQSPTLGAVSPEVFIGLAEQAGFIHQLTSWVVGEACRHQAQWRRLGMELQVSINIAAQDLVADDFVDMLEAYLAQYDLPSSCLCLEITERDMMTNIDSSLSVLNYLSARGFNIAIDDYGVGYSALSQLSLLPVNELKIDKCFITHLCQQREHQVIVQSTIDMAHQLNMDVIAEGVEDDECAAWLAAASCDYIQGYYVAKPIPEEDIRDWLRHQAVLESAKTDFQ